MNNLIWFKNDLRVQDNASLSKAISGEKVIAYYCFESLFFQKDKNGFRRTEKYRAKFLIESIHQLKNELKKLNIELFVHIGNSANILPELIQTHGIDTIYQQQEWTRDELFILNEVQANVPAAVKFIETYDQFLFHPEDIPYVDFSSIPEVFTQFRKKIEAHAQVRPTISNVDKKANLKGINNPTKIPSLQDLGFAEFEVDSRTAFPFKGGELEGLKRIEHYFWDTKKLAFYKKTRNGLIGRDYSSKLSAWLANGSISPRTIYWEIKKFEKEITKNQGTYWLIFELIWRDYFKFISLKHQSNIFKIGGILQRKYDWQYDLQVRNNWMHGTTKDSFVNANMKELAMTGWMSNRGRQNVSSYWSKNLILDWRIGAGYFESMLIDYDVHSNWANWMYTSGVGNDPRDRIFNTKMQAERYDPNGKFQKLWLQETLF